MRRPSVRVLPVLVVIATVSIPAWGHQASQAPPPTGQANPRPQTPTFRSGIDLVAVDASVIDRNGRPVDDLRPEEFRLEVGGKPRRVMSAEFVSFRDTGAAPGRRAFSTNLGQPPGRLIMLVIDEGNLRKGAVKPVVSAALAFIDRLGPADRVALQLIPGAGPLVNFTADHALVKRTLENSAGRVVEADRTDRVGVAEAIEMLERPVPAGTAPPINSPLAAVMERECPGEYDASGISRCRSQLENLARSVSGEARARAQATLVSLREIVERLAVSIDPKTLVLVSSGILVKDFADASWIEERTAAASVGFYALRVDQDQLEATMSRRSPSRTSDRDLMIDGLNLVVGLARGTVWALGGNPSVTFERLRLEMSGHYLLSFEPAPDERDGKAREISIGVTRPDLRVTGRRRFSVEATAAAPVIDEQLADVIRAPLLFSDFEVRVTTYSFQDPATGRIKILVGADVDAAAGPASDIGLAYAVTGENGRIVAADVERPAAASADAPRGRQFTGSFLVDPGSYDIKVAAIGTGGRHGSVEHHFDAGVKSFGQLRLGDLLVAAPPAAGGSVRPAVDGRVTAQTMVGYSEVYSEADAQLDAATLRFEIADSAEGRAIASAPMRLEPTGATRGRRAAEGSLPLVLVPPGEYIARVVLQVDGRDAIAVTRPVTIEVAATPPTAAVAPDAVPLPVVPFESRPETFERSSVLSRAVVGHFLNRLSGPDLPPLPESLMPAIGLARSMRLLDARRTALASAPDHFAARFIAGIADLADGNLQSAAQQFGGVLQVTPAFTPAAFYLGAAYAAAGRDADALTAWQSSFVTDRQAPWQHTVMIDAQLRLKQSPRALAAAREAAAIWPDSDAVRMRLAMALAQTGADREAMSVLVPYLARHPDDLGRLLLGMQLIYGARAAGRTFETVEADRQRFHAYFGLYERANGPELETAREWKRVVDREWGRWR